MESFFMKLCGVLIGIRVPKENCKIKVRKTRMFRGSRELAWFVRHWTQNLN